PNNQGAMVTLVERNTLMTLIRKLPNGKKAEDVVNAVYSMLAPYRRHNAVLTITTDNGSEFALHKEIANALNVDIYFAHPYCSWEKGCIENTNKLIRQYIKKKVAFDDYSTEEVRRVQKLLNNYCCPIKVFQREKSRLLHRTAEFPACQISDYSTEPIKCLL
ncbi:IS30 family transposase, partial [Porphyromonas somerae]|uniref:IS30 family transposase n=1 Tax=Porphyromonas somerae TaxID=322095 RepID=UPI002A913DC1